jgi:hypothetical protein
MAHRAQTAIVVRGTRVPLEKRSGWLSAQRGGEVGAATRLGRHQFDRHREQLVADNVPHLDLDCVAPFAIGAKHIQREQLREITSLFDAQKLAAFKVELNRRTSCQVKKVPLHLGTRLRLMPIR